MSADGPLPSTHRNLTPEEIRSIHNVTVVGSGEPLVFAHGFGSNQSIWRNQVQAFRDSHRLVLFDHVGAVPSNYSAFDPARYAAMETFAQDLLSILDALRLEPCVVVGHSMSGLAALIAAAQDPARIRKVVTIGASASYRNLPGYTGGFEHDELIAIHKEMRADYRGWAARFAHAMTDTEGDVPDAAQFARTLAALPPEIAVATFRLATECDYRHILPKVRVPVDVIQSGRDVAVPVEAASYLVEAIPTATLAVLATRGHLPHVTAPELLNSILMRCLY